MDDNEKESVSKFLDFAKFVVIALLVAGGLVSSAALGL